MTVERALVTVFFAFRQTLPVITARATAFITAPPAFLGRQLLYTMRRSVFTSDSPVLGRGMRKNLTLHSPWERVLHSESSLSRRIVVGFYDEKLSESGFKDLRIFRMLFTYNRIFSSILFIL